MRRVLHRTVYEEVPACGTGIGLVLVVRARDTLGLTEKVERD